MKILGWEIFNSRKPKLENLKAIVPKDDDSGALIVGTNMSSFFSYDQTTLANNDAELLTKYRDLTFIPEVDLAIEEIVNEMIVTSESNPIVTLNLDSLRASNDFKEKVIEEFEYLLTLLDFQNNAYDYARRWYIDGRIFFHILIDIKNPRAGILDVRQLESMTIKKIKEVERELDENQVPIIKSVNEYYLYNERGTSPAGPSVIIPTTLDVRISVDSIAYSNSGLVDPVSGMVLSYLHKAMKVANQLAMIESAIIIYMLARAPERRVFYIDTGDMPKGKAEQYMNEQIARFRNKMVFDPSTGEIIDKKNFLSMMEDFWIPRRAGSRATEIQPLAGGQGNLIGNDQLEYFRQRLYKALNIPLLRLQPDTTISYSKETAITREELKFARFIDKMRKRFSNFIYDLLRKQLILKGAITPNDWNRIKNDIFIEYQRDSYYSEVKDAEIFSDRVELINNAKDLIGEFLSEEYIYKNIFHFSDEEIQQEKERIKLEKEQKVKEKKGQPGGEEGGDEFGGGNEDFGGGLAGPEEGFSAPPPPPTEMTPPPANTEQPTGTATVTPNPATAPTTT